jgi:hypothetical protein
MRSMTLLTILLTVTPASAQPKEKLNDVQKKERLAALNTAFPRLEADYLALVKKSRAELDEAKARFERDKDVHAYQIAIHRRSTGSFGTSFWRWKSSRTREVEFAPVSDRLSGKWSLAYQSP